jgi:hypothetical protein
MMEAVRTSETANFNETTRRYIPAGYHLYSRRRDDQQTHKPD